MSTLQEIATTLLSTDAFKAGLLTFVTNRYCVIDHSIQNLQVDRFQPPTYATEAGCVFVAFLYIDQKDTENEEAYPVLYYGPPDGTGKFQDDIHHYPDCSGMSCEDHGCPLIDDGEDEEATG